MFLVSGVIENTSCSQALLVGAPGGSVGRAQDSLFPLDSAFYPNLSCTGGLCCNKCDHGGSWSFCSWVGAPHGPPAAEMTRCNTVSWPLLVRWWRRYLWSLAFSYRQMELVSFCKKVLCRTLCWKLLSGLLKFCSPPQSSQPLHLIMNQ